MKNKQALQNQLEADIEQYQAMLEDEINQKKALLKKVAVIGGIITVGYVVTSALVSEENKNKVATAKESSLVKLLVGVATPLLVNFLKAKFAKRP